MAHKRLAGTITSEDMLGKDVIDSGGAFIGVSDKLYIDPKRMAVLGISVDRGFLKKGFVIGTRYVREVARHAIFLNIRPASRLKGMVLLDRDGVRIGVIRGIELIEDTNEVSSLFVKPGMFRRTIRVPAKYMKDAQRSAFLSITKDELRARLSGKAKGK